MWKTLWRRWTIDRPAALGDWLWEVCVVQLAAFLNRLTLRQIIAFIPVVILVLAYCHSIPLPPELVLIGDLLAYIDIFSVVLLLGMLSRAATILFVIRRAATRVEALALHLMMRRRDVRHRRERSNARPQQRLGRNSDDDRPPVAARLAWA